MYPFQLILCPTDFSEYAQAAVHLAGMLAQKPGARLLVLHVLDVEFGRVSYAGIPVEIRPEDYPQRLREQLHHVRPEDPAVPVEHLLQRGRPAEEILRVARERSCDLIVMGTHGLTGLRHALLGSVAERVVRQAECPVLTVKWPGGGSPGGP